MDNQFYYIKNFVKRCGLASYFILLFFLGSGLYPNYSNFSQTERVTRGKR